MTAKLLYRQFLEQLQTLYGLSEATVITDWTFKKIAGINKMAFIKDASFELTATAEKQLQEALTALLLHKPVQYVLGEAWFGTLQLLVNEHVLIPRPETEELVHWIVTTEKEAIKDKAISILDIGAGSGCIPIYLKKALPNASITSIDVSKNALDVAIKNAGTHQAIIHFKQLDFLEEKSWSELEQFDIIVSNPPYIPSLEKETMDANVTQYEPGIALFVPDKSPLIFYEKIALFAATHLIETGKVFVEIHEDFAAETTTIFEEYFKFVVIKKDLLGKDRMIAATHFH